MSKPPDPVPGRVVARIDNSCFGYYTPQLVRFIQTVANFSSDLLARI